MKNSLLAMTLLLLGMSAPASGAEPAPSLLPARVQDAVQERIAAGEYPALVIAVVDGARSHVYGFGKLADGKPPDANSVFEIGSVTKTFTGLLLAEAVISGSVTPEEPVAKLLPGFTIPSRDGKFITLGNLATQHSGLPRIPDNLSPADIHNPYADYDAGRLKALLADYKLTRDPGSKYEYSNLGFGLLGYALAQWAHTTYGELVRTRVLEPLAMHDSAVVLDDAMRSHLAVGHDESGKAAENWDMDVLAGAGAIKSTGADMLRYLEANMGVRKTPLYPAMQLAHRPRAAVGGDEKIGFAWMTRHAGNRELIWHNGMTGGYASFIGFDVAARRGVVVLTNIQQTVDDIGFASLLADTELTPARKPVHLDPRALDAYVGSYRLAPHFMLTVFRKDRQLFAQATGQGAFQIFPGSKDEFFARIADIRISFRRDAQGGVTGLVLHQNGDHAAPKVSGAEAAQAVTGKPAVNVPASVLREYVGRYQLGPQAVFDISLRGDQLYARLGDQPAFPVYASAPDRFFYTVVDAQLDFIRADGNIVALVLHQGGRDLRAPRLPQ